MKLTHTQLVLLSAAARRTDRALELPANLKGGAAQKVLGKLLTEGLTKESRARSGMPVWRDDEEGRPIALHLTRQGLAAVQATQDPDQEEHPDSKGHAAKQPKGKNKTSTKSARSGQSGSKQGAIIALLSRPEGAPIATIMKATGWQQHSVRGFLAAIVRKKLGLNLQSEKPAGERVYRIITKPSRAAA